MSREAVLMLDCSRYSEKIIDIIQLLNKAGWGFRNDRMEYLPEHDDGMFDWQEDILSYERLSDIINRKQQQHELIGVVLYDRDSDAGISLLAESTKEIRCSLDINRKTIDGDFTDISWYIRHVAVRMQEKGCVTEQLQYNEYTG